MAHRYASEAPKGSNARGGFVLEVEMVRGIRWMRERLLTGGEAARREFVPAEDLAKMIAPSKYLFPSPFCPIFSDGLVVSG